MRIGNNIGERECFFLFLNGNGIGWPLFLLFTKYLNQPHTLNAKLRVTSTNYIKHGGQGTTLQE